MLYQKTQYPISVINVMQNISQENEKYIIPLKDDAKVDFHEWEAGDYPLHYHDHYEMELVISGSGSQILNGENFKLEKGDVFLLRPLDFHKIHSDGIEFVCLNINPSIVPKWIISKLNSMKQAVVCHLSDEDYDNFICLINVLNKEINEKSNDLYLIKTTTVSLIFSLFLKQNKGNILDDDIVLRVIYYLQKDYRFTKKVSLDEIANYLGYSKYYTSTKFHKKYGMTIQDFIINLKIEYSKKLLVESNYSITEIIMESGFSSLSNFYAIFRKIVGCTPLEFKKRHRLSN